MAAFNACPAFYNENAVFGACPSKYSSVFGKDAFATPSSWNNNTFGGFNNWNNNNTFGGFAGLNNTWNNNTFGGFNGINGWNNFNGLNNTVFNNWNNNNTFGGFNGLNSTFGAGFNNWGNNTFGGFNNWNANNTFGGFDNVFNNSWTGAFDGSNAFSNNTLCSAAFRPSSECEYFTLKNPIRALPDGSRGLWLCFDLRGYKPEEVCVTVNKAERAVVIEAAHEIKDSKEHQVTRKFTRKFVLPECLSKVDITKIEFKSFFGPDSFFYVEGSIPKCAEAEWSSWPAYPWTVSHWSNPTWAAITSKNCGNNNTWAAGNNWNNWNNTWANNWNNNTWANNTWANNACWTNTWNSAKPVATKTC